MQDETNIRDPRAWVQAQGWEYVMAFTYFLRDDQTLKLIIDTVLTTDDLVDIASATEPTGPSTEVAST